MFLNCHENDMFSPSSACKQQHVQGSTGGRADYSYGILEKGFFSPFACREGMSCTAERLGFSLVLRDYLTNATIYIIYMFVQDGLMNKRWCGITGVSDAGGGSRFGNSSKQE